MSTETKQEKVVENQNIENTGKNTQTEITDQQQGGSVINKEKQGGENSQVKQYSHQPQGGWVQGGNLRFNNKKKKGKKHNKTAGSGDEGGHLKNKKWTEEELKELYSEYFELLSKFLETKTKTQLLAEPLNSLVKQLDECTKNKQPSKFAKELFNEFRRTSEGICRVLISENDEKFNKDELKHFVVLLKELKDLTIKSKLNEKDLAKEKQKLIQSLENVNKSGKFGANFNLPDALTLGDTCSTILNNLVISIEALHNILGNREKFWPKLGGELGGTQQTGTVTTTGTTTSSTGTSSPNTVGSKKAPKFDKKKKKNSKKLKKKVFKVTHLAKEITEEFGKTVQRNTIEEEGLYDQNDELDDKFKRNDKRKQGQVGGQQQNNDKQGGGKKGPVGNNNKKKVNDKKNRKGPKGDKQKNVEQQTENKSFEKSEKIEGENYETPLKENDGKFETRQPFGVDHHFLINKKVWKNLEATKDGKIIIKDRSDSSDDQQWKFEHLGIGFFRIINKSGKVLSRTEKDEVVLEDLNNERNQNWILVKQFFGRRAYYLIFNVQKTKTLILDLVSNVVSLQFKNGPSDNDAWKIK